MKGQSNVLNQSFQLFLKRNFEVGEVRSVSKCMKMANHPAVPSEPHPINKNCPKFILKFMNPDSHSKANRTANSHRIELRHLAELAGYEFEVVQVSMGFEPCWGQAALWTGRDLNPGPPRCQRGDHTRLIYRPSETVSAIDSF
jgi:hypothetical protein